GGRLTSAWEARETSPQPGRKLRGGKVTGHRETGRRETGRKGTGGKTTGGEGEGSRGDRKEGEGSGGDGREDNRGEGEGVAETGGKEKGVAETGGKEKRKGVGETGGKTTGVKERGVGETGGKEKGSGETEGKGSGQNVMEGIERKSYSAAVIEGVRKRARVFVGDSIVRKTDRVLNKGDDVVVCLPGAKIEAITERVKNIVGSVARCRFASTSASRGSCIFPCRCTNGCNTITGECIDGGQCEDGHPSGYRWSGQACQIGNVAYGKTPSQIGGGTIYAAEKAVDGNTDPLIYHRHCAHPETPTGTNAWWMVDFGERYNTSRVVIYNRGDCCNQRLDTFVLSVGDSDDRQSHRECARHNGRVRLSGTVEKTCNAVAQYLSFRRNGGHQSHLTALCEVVVIGHTYTDCLQCPRGTACNDVIGCDACAPGKQQPNCVKVCDEGSYGVNCQKDCGNCKDKLPCNVTNGHCTNGCKLWYTHDICKTEIPKPFFETSQKPQVDVITNSSAVVSWPKANDIPSGLEAHYYYVVWLQTDGETWRNVTQIVQDPDGNKLESPIAGLVFNTHYSVKVEPYRQHKETHEGGSTTNVATFKTSCIAPTIHIITVNKLTPDGAKNASVVVTWQTIKESGCDEVVSLGVLYKSQLSQNDTWSYKEAETMNQTQLTIDVLSYELYEVKVTAMNNENISSTSETRIADLRTTTTTTTTTTTPLRSNTQGTVAGKGKAQTGGGLGAGGTAGVAVAVIIVIAAVIVVVSIVLLRRRRAEQQQKTTDNIVRFKNPDKSGPGEENVAFDDGIAAEEEEGNQNVDQAESSTAIYANTQQVTHGVTTGDLASYVEDKRRHNGFEKEFADLPYGIHAKCEAAKKPENKSRNRFLNIIAYDHTRVVLSAETGQSDYVNANHIMGYDDKKNAYIACQGPRDWNIEDMFSMIWQEKSNTIVMLANLVEMGKEKCSRYWPEKGKPQKWGSFVVEGISEEKFADYVIRKFSLKNEMLKKMRRMRQFHFTSWPDKGTPEYAYPLLAFHRKVHGFDSEKRGPFVVHCSAGVGRTGTFIAIDILIEQAKAEGKVDVFQCVNLLRTQRMNMVQTLEQYIYVYQALIEFNEVAVIPCSELRQTFEDLCRNSKLAEQFERLNALKPHRKNDKCAALEPNNVAKNRFIEIIPDDHQRPYLVTPWKEGTNYINAVYVHGYKERNAYIITQSPMAATVVDMWRLLNDHESRTVVMLDDSDVTDDECAIYWPNQKATKRHYGPFQVVLVQTDITENPKVTVREFKLSKSGRSEDSETVIKQFQLNHSWSDDSSIPSNTTVLVDLLDAVEKWQQQSGNGPIVVHCTDGSSRSGLLCAASYVLEHMKVEQEVDVFHAVQHVRTTRPQLITHLAQYRFLYEVALAYMSQFDTYANFQ
ncbi:hypothetical protein LSAT2_029625, partial [Lamellibrachia satsuma]